MLCPQRGGDLAEIAPPLRPQRGGEIAPLFCSQWGGDPAQITPPVWSGGILCPPKEDVIWLRSPPLCVPNRKVICSNQFVFGNTKGQ
jgi:hypothetical protein